MSKLIYVYNRTSNLDASTDTKLRSICDQLVPDNVSSVPDHSVRVCGKNAYAVAMRSSLVRESGLSLLLGLLYEAPDTRWDIPQGVYPDGSYAIIRDDPGFLEVVSDATATRTMWYFLDEHVFIASTSQRAIVAYLGSFEFDQRVIPWMLSTGTLGPEHSYDRRLKRLQADSSIVLDKARWTLRVKSNPIVLAAERFSEREHRDRLRAAIHKTMRALEAFDGRGLVLPLSGGYDSRAILCFMDADRRRAEGFRTVTWGLASSLNEPGNDAAVAVELARSLDVKHEYLPLDASREPIESIIDRFIACGEGRVDHLSGYMDGMEIWRRLHETGVAGIIRGDEGFGSEQVTSEFTVKRHTWLSTCSDYENLKGVTEQYGFPAQEVPAALLRRSAESLSAWRDRLYHSYRLPTAYAALSEIKGSYVDVVNPLLSKAILSVVRSVPDRLRTEKTLFKRVVREVGPAVPFATKHAIGSPYDILQRKEVVELLRAELTSEYARRTLGAGFVEFVSRGLRAPANGAQRPRRRLVNVTRIRASVPRVVRNWLRDAAVGQRVDGNRLAFRVFIVLKMHRALSTAWSANALPRTAELELMSATDWRSTPVPGAAPGFETPPA